MTTEPNNQPIFPQSDQNARKSRRGLIKGAAIAAFAAAAGYVGWTRFFFPPSSPRPWDGTLGSTHRGSIALGSVTEFAQSTDPVEAPLLGQAVFVDFTGGAPKVLSAQCTHAGCTVRWNHAAQQYDCPCHGSVFARNGAVVRGPASVPLITVPSVVEGQTVYATT